MRTNEIMMCFVKQTSDYKRKNLKAVYRFHTFSAKKTLKLGKLNGLKTQLSFLYDI
jgi:hypothetical protein